MTSTTNRVTSMSNKTVGYAEIEEATGVPAVTARRYATTFRRWLPGKTVGRSTRFPVATLNTFSQIRALFEAGKTTSEVREVLAASVHPTFEVDEITEPAEQATPAVSGAELPALLALGDRFVSALERIALALETVAAKRPLEASKDGGRVKVQGEGQTSIVGHPGTSVPAKSRAEIVAEVIRLHEQGMGAGAIATAMRRAGWPTLSGRGAWGKGSVSRILKGAKND